MWRAAAKGRDVLAVAQPGSGKTLAYLLAMAARLMGAPSTGASAADLAPAPRGLVLLPTRCAAPCLQPCMQWHHGAPSPERSSSSTCVSARTSMSLVRALAWHGGHCSAHLLVALRLMR